MVDSDSLKAVNDRFGHDTGNRLLEYTVKCIDDALRKNPMRPPDTVARYGGDEFLVLLPETPCAAATGVAERIRRTMESSPFMANGQTFAATVSIGVASYPDHGATLDAILKRADEAMYASKAGGKNRITVSGA
jgi:diguanylate cyclase (GGDEF)-like protein